MDIAQILLVKYAGAEWILDGNNYSGLTWFSATPKPTEQQLQSLWPSVEAYLKLQTQEKIEARASAIIKLKSLGLTVTEVEATFGLIK